MKAEKDVQYFLDSSRPVASSPLSILPISKMSYHPGIFIPKLQVMALVGLDREKGEKLSVLLVYSFFGAKCMHVAYALGRMNFTLGRSL